MPTRSQIRRDVLFAPGQTGPTNVAAAVSERRVRTIRHRAGSRHARVRVALRVGAAAMAGYFFAHGATAFLTLVLPFARVDRVSFANLLSLSVWCAAVVYVFAAPSTWRAWWVPTLAGAVLFGIALLFPEWAARP